MHADNAQLQRDLGRLEGKVDAMVTEQAKMAVALTTAVAYIERDKGGKRAMMTAAAGLSAIVGGAISLFVAWLHRP